MSGWTARAMPTWTPPPWCTPGAWCWRTSPRATGPTPTRTGCTRYSFDWPGSTRRPWWSSPTIGSSPGGPIGFSCSRTVGWRRSARWTRYPDAVRQLQGARRGHQPDASGARHESHAPPVRAVCAAEGRRDRRVGAQDAAPRLQLLELKEQLRRAVENENFELAAELRDRIRVLE